MSTNNGDTDAWITFEAFKARFAVLDVGRRAERGVSLDELRQTYPDLAESDLEFSQAGRWRAEGVVVREYWHRPDAIS